MRGEINKVDQSVEQAIQQAKFASGGRASVKMITETHNARQDMQAGLRSIIEIWAGYERDKGRPDCEIYRLFYLKFGVDMMTAQTLKTKEAAKLSNKLCKTFVT